MWSQLRHTGRSEKKLASSIGDKEREEDATFLEFANSIGIGNVNPPEIPGNSNNLKSAPSLDRKAPISSPPRASPQPPQATLDDYQPPLSRDHPCMWALSYDQLMQVDFLAKESYLSFRYKQISMRDINQHIIIPRCQACGTSYALSLNPKGRKVDAFITHCWDEKFAEFIESIQSAFRHFPEKPNLWICAFAIQQGNLKTVQKQLDVPLKDSPFVQALQHAVWFVVTRNNQVDLYSRAWCVAELYFAREFGFTATGKSRTMVVGPDKFSHLRTTCTDAQAYNPSDKSKILRELRESQGLAAVDQLVLQYRKHGTQRTGPPSLRWLYEVILVGILLGIGLSLGIQEYSIQQHMRTSTLFVKLPASSKLSILESRRSPQARALRWAVQQWSYVSEQRFALVLLYHALGGSRTFSSSWEIYPHYHECYWSTPECRAQPRDCEVTIVCDKSKYLTKISYNKIVKSISFFPTRGLKGTLPPEIFMLQSLTALRIGASGTFKKEADKLSFPGLQGSLPTEIGLLKRLEVLEIESSSLSARIPSELGRLTQLQSLVLRTNQQFLGGIPTELGLLTSLVHLQVNGNLTGRVPAELGGLTSLLSLNLKNNALSWEKDSSLLSLPEVALTLD